MVSIELLVDEIVDFFRLGLFPPQRLLTFDGRLSDPKAVRRSAGSNAEGIRRERRIFDHHLRLCVDRRAVLGEERPGGLVKIKVVRRVEFLIPLKIIKRLARGVIIGIPHDCPLAECGVSFSLLAMGCCNRPR